MKMPTTIDHDEFPTEWKIPGYTDIVAAEYEAGQQRYRQ
jgi:hypothetical protein